MDYTSYVNFIYESERKLKFGLPPCVFCNETFYDECKNMSLECEAFIEYCSRSLGLFCQKSIGKNREKINNMLNIRFKGKSKRKKYYKNCTLIKAVLHGYVAETDRAPSELCCQTCIERGMAGCGKEVKK